MFHNKHRCHNGLQLAGLCLWLTGCSFSPSIPVFGAAFPDWLFCIAGGLLVTGCVHVLLTKQGWQAYVAPQLLSYAALTLIFSVIIWFLFF